MRRVVLCIDRATTVTCCLDLGAFGWGCIFVATVENMDCCNSWLVVCWNRSNWFWLIIPVKLLHSCPIIMWLGTWIYWLELRATDIGNSILGNNFIILLAGSSWYRTRAMFCSSREGRLAVEKRVMGITTLGGYCSCLVSLASASSTITQMVSRLSTDTVFIILFEFEIKIGMGRELCGIIFSLL